MQFRPVIISYGKACRTSLYTDQVRDVLEGIAKDIGSGCTVEDPIAGLGMEVCIKSGTIFLNVLRTLTLTQALKYVKRIEPEIDSPSGLILGHDGQTKAEFRKALGALVKNMRANVDAWMWLMTEDQLRFWLD